MTRRIVIILAILVCTIFAGKFDAHTRILESLDEYSTPEFYQSEFIRSNFSISDDGYVDLLVSHRDSWTPPGFARLYSDRFSIATIAVPISRLGILRENPDILWVEASSYLEPNLDVSVPETSAPSIWSETSGGKGDGVIVGILDTGIDYEHPDFDGSGESNRVLAIWDLTESVGTSPAGFDYGTLWDHGSILDGSCTQEDFYGHGTHVASIAAGDDEVFTGMAPEADIVVVKGGNYGFWSHDIANGISWLTDFAIEQGKPISMNMSLGGGYGPHDGSLLYERIVGSCTGPGAILNISAGNSRNSETHYQCSPSEGSPDSIILTADMGYYHREGALNDYMMLSGWYDGADSIAVTLISPHGRTYGPIAPEDDIVIQSDGDGTVWIDNCSDGPGFNGDRCITFILIDADEDEPPAAGNWKILFEGESEVHGWLYSRSFSIGLQEDYIVNTHIVGPPGTTDEAVTVACYCTKKKWVNNYGDTVSRGWYTVDELSSFSSPGPTRTGKQKPDISAPGQVIAAASSNSSVQSRWWQTEDGEHVLMQGTSMSCPHVTGAAALLLQADPALTPSRFKQLLYNNAETDSFVGSVPNFDWGAGKMNIDGAFEELSPTEAKPLRNNIAEAGSAYVLSQEYFIGSVPEGTQEIRIEVDVYDGNGSLRIRYNEWPWFFDYDTSITVAGLDNELILSSSGPYPPEFGDIYLRFDCMALSLTFDVTMQCIYEWGSNRIIGVDQTAPESVSVVFGQPPLGDVENLAHWTLTANGDTIAITDAELVSDDLILQLEDEIPEGTVARLHYQGLRELYDSGWEYVNTLWPIIQDMYYHNVVWDDTTYPYYVDWCEIKASGSLTIMPGVRVAALYSDSYIKVEGGIQISGNSDNPVEFYKINHEGNWGGLEINGRRYAHQIINANFRETRTALDLRSTEIDIHRVDIRNGRCGIALNGNSDLSAKNLLIANLNDASADPTELVGIRSFKGDIIDVVNATFDSIYYSAVAIDTVGSLSVRNAIFTRCGTGIDILTTYPNCVDYSCFWINDVDTWGPIILGDNIVYDNPDYVGGTPIDYHLRSSSPCIDAGDPTILDDDSSRSDIGFYGGNYTDDIAERKMPKDWKVSVYPNPFNSAVKIQSNIEAKISGVEIFDITGRSIVDLDYIENPVESVLWSPSSNLPSGIYFVKIDSDSDTKTTKVLLLR